MKKRISGRKKAVRSKSEAWHKKKHLRVHAFLIYISASIFLFTVFAAVVHFFIKPIAQQNETYYASDNTILGESESYEDDSLEQDMNQLEEEQRKTEKEMSELNGDRLYQKAVGSPTRAPDPLEDKKREIVEKVIDTGVIDDLDEKSTSTDSGAVVSTVEDNKPVYRIAGLKRFKFLGFIPVTQPVIVVVSSETGIELKTEEPFFTSFVDFLSP